MCDPLTLEVGVVGEAAVGLPELDPDHAAQLTQRAPWRRLAEMWHGTLGLQLTA